jgi:hypothetical protein
MRLVSFHAGVTIDQIQSKTGFDLVISPDIRETPPPTEEELDLLRNEIDPLSIRKLELLSGSKRRSLLHEIVYQENRQFTSSP